MSTSSRAQLPKARRTTDDAPPALRLLILERDRWQCQRCGQRLQNTNPRAKDYGHAGHRVARIEGGTPTEDNLQAECLGCNLAAGGAAGHRSTRGRLEAYERETQAQRAEIARLRAEGSGAPGSSENAHAPSDLGLGGAIFNPVGPAKESPPRRLLPTRAASGSTAANPGESGITAGQGPKSNTVRTARAAGSSSARTRDRLPAKGSRAPAEPKGDNGSRGVTSGIGGRHSEPAEWRSVPWLAGLHRPPASATWPRFMSPPHPAAVGSFGAAFEKRTKARTGRELRWWQRLAARRILEHDADAQLCWPEWLLTLSRQGGKSWLLRELAMDRLAQAERFGEPQFVMHVGNRLVNATEVQAPARAWAKAQPDGWRAFEAQGTQEVRDPNGNRWRCFAQNAVYGFSAGLALVDEAWEIEAAAVEDGIEPTQIERAQPQLGLISTAHGRATSLVIDRRRTALAGGSGLILEWSGPPWLELGDRAGWRAASPHWSPQREALMLRAYRKALSPRSSRLDEQDPVTTFRTQWLNQWPERSSLNAGLAGHPLLGDGVWAGLERPADIEGPITFAIEDNAGVSVAIAAAGRTADDLITVEAYSISDRRLGWEWIAAHADRHPGSVVMVGSSLADDREVTELPCRAETMAYADTRHALSLLRTVAGRQGLAHSGSPGLAEQIDLCRVADGSTGAGLRVTSGDRWDILRAAAWAIAAVERQRNAEPAIY